MTRRWSLRLLISGLILSLNMCATYVPPSPASPDAFSKDLHASYGATWSAVTFVAGQNFFKIKSFEKASGLMTLDFDLKNINPYVDCGTSQNTTTHTVSPALQALGLSALSLSGTANINIKEEDAHKTAIQFNSQYELDGYRMDLYGVLTRVAHWEFNSGSSDTQNIGLGVLVTCRPSYKIETDFLNEVAARV